MWKECDVILLPSDEKLNGMICLDISEQDMQMYIKTRWVCQHDDYIGHHLYITSNDPIQDEEHYVSFERDYATEPKERYVLYVKSTGLNGENPRKIIATTNTSLKQPIPESLSDYPFSYTPKSLLQPPSEFIQKYVEEYNRGNIITKVLVEYNIIPFSVSSPNRDRGEGDVKINTEDNTITIKEIKTQWDRDELIEILIKCCGEVSCIDGKLYGKTPAELYLWIKDNI